MTGPRSALGPGSHTACCLSWEIRAAQQQLSNRGHNLHLPQPPSVLAPSTCGSKRLLTPPSQHTDTSEADVWLNDPAVRSALHAAPADVVGAPWTVCRCGARPASSLNPSLLWPDRFETSCYLKGEGKCMLGRPFTCPNPLSRPRSDRILYTHDSGSMLWIHKEMTQKRGEGAALRRANAVAAAACARLTAGLQQPCIQACFHAPNTQLAHCPCSPRTARSTPACARCSTAVTTPWPCPTHTTHTITCYSQRTHPHYNTNYTGLRALIYSGDHDMAVPHTGSEAWTADLGLKKRAAWAPWVRTRCCRLPACIGSAGCMYSRLIASVPGCARCRQPAAPAPTGCLCGV